PGGNRTRRAGNVPGPADRSSGTGFQGARPVRRSPLARHARSDGRRNRYRFRPPLIGLRSPSIAETKGGSRILSESPAVVRGPLFDRPRSVPYRVASTVRPRRLHSHSFGGARKEPRSSPRPFVRADRHARSVRALAHG